MGTIDRCCVVLLDAGNGKNMKRGWGGGWGNAMFSTNFLAIAYGSD